jgi:hypothetical protein
MTIWFQFGSNEKVPISFQSSQKVGINMYWNVTFFDIYFLKLFPKPFYIPPKLEPHLKGIIPNIIWMNSFQKIKNIKKCSEETYIKQHEFNLLLCMCVLNSTLYEANYYYRYFLSMVEIVQYSFKYSWRGDGANVKVKVPQVVWTHLRGTVETTKHVLRRGIVYRG